MNQEIENVHLVHVMEEIPKDKGPSIFLAGPTLRSSQVEPTGFEHWRCKVTVELVKQGFEGVIILPTWRDGKTKPEGWTYSRQVSWELEGLDKADVILFWIPRDLNILPGFTTNIELGQYIDSGKIVIGAPLAAAKMNYIAERSGRLKINMVITIPQVCHEALKKIKELKNKKGKVWLIADTHFGSQRTLEMSKRPFDSVKEMDWTMVKNWNERVTGDDTVIHLGDFGDVEILKSLEYKELMLLPGNYDSEIKDGMLFLHNNMLFDAGGKAGLFLGHHKDLHPHPERLFRIVHEPEKAAYPEDFYLFAHIHKLQMVKRNGLNAGVDCHNFCPFDMDTAWFYRTAIKKYYDKNVFMPISELHEKDIER